MKDFLEEFNELQRKFHALYRASGERARGRRRGLKFRMEEIRQMPGFQRAYEAQFYNRRSNSALRTISLLSAIWGYR